MVDTPSAQLAWSGPGLEALSSGGVHSVLKAIANGYASVVTTT
jgi:hypothetical protein